jgi:hypothetical protein
MVKPYTSYTSGDPEILHNNIHYFRTHIFANNPEIGCAPKELKEATEAALMIRRADPVLQPVPLAKDPNRPTEQDFIRLEQWFLDAETAWKENKEDAAPPKAKSRTKNEKIALIADELGKNPNATSAEIEKVTGIDKSGVRQLWRPIKKMNQRGKLRGYKAEGKTDGEDTSASCSICRVPLSKPFECSLCKEIISGECKDCHYTNTHPNDAVP